MSEFVTRKEYEEHNKRMDDEHIRTNHRLKALEEIVKQINDLTVSVHEMAISMKSMLEEQKEQGARIGKLESRDGEMWRKILTHGLTTILGIVIGYIFIKIGIGG